MYRQKLYVTVLLLAVGGCPQAATPFLSQYERIDLLIENGIYLLESIYLEEIAREKVYEFAFIMLPLKIKGATGSMVDPLAVI